MLPLGREVRSHADSRLLCIGVTLSPFGGIYDCLFVPSCFKIFTMQYIDGNILSFTVLAFDELFKSENNPFS